MSAKTFELLLCFVNEHVRGTRYTKKSLPLFLLNAFLKELRVTREKQKQSAIEELSRLLNHRLAEEDDDHYFDPTTEASLLRCMKSALQPRYEKSNAKEEAKRKKERKEQEAKAEERDAIEREREAKQLEETKKSIKGQVCFFRQDDQESLYLDDLWYSRNTSTGLVPFEMKEFKDLGDMKYSARIVSRFPLTIANVRFIKAHPNADVKELPDQKSPNEDLLVMFKNPVCERLISTSLSNWHWTAFSESEANKKAASADSRDKVFFKFDIVIR